MQPYAPYRNQLPKTPALFSNSLVDIGPDLIQQTASDRTTGKATCQLCDQVTYAKVRHARAGAPFWDFSEHFPSYCHALSGMRDLPGAVWDHEEGSWTVLEEQRVHGDAETVKLVQGPLQTSKPSEYDHHNYSEPGHTLPVQQPFQSDNPFNNDSHKDTADSLKHHLAENLEGWFPERKKARTHVPAQSSGLETYFKCDDTRAGKRNSEDLPTEQAGELQDTGSYDTFGSQHPATEMASCMYCGQVIAGDGQSGELMQHLLSGCKKFQLAGH